MAVYVHTFAHDTRLLKRPNSSTVKIHLSSTDHCLREPRVFAELSLLGRVFGIVPQRDLSFDVPHTS